MYIKKILIENIKSIKNLEVVFDDQSLAGWHVFIGDNGSGKTTVVRSAALVLLGKEDAIRTRENWKEWLNKSSETGTVKVTIQKPAPKKTPSAESRNGDFECEITFKHNSSATGINQNIDWNFQTNLPNLSVENENADDKPIQRFFAVSYGPYRRFSGGNVEKEKIYYSHPNLGAHLSVFGEDVALSAAIPFLKELYVKKLENSETGNYLDNLIGFINDGGLLPHGTKIDYVDSMGVYFKDGNNQTIDAFNMSDGFRSILSLTFELIRQLVRVYGEDKVFEKIISGENCIDLPGVVLIDEIDSHLHPSWQVRVGDWFLKYFPKIQFIVTTHSPLICHAASKGSVWRLAAPGSAYQSGEVTGTELKRLLYGNILDAFGTELFGVISTLSEEGKLMRERLAILRAKALDGEISEVERKEMHQLRTQMPTEL